MASIRTQADDEGMYEVIHKMVVIRDMPSTTGQTKGALRSGIKVAGTPHLIDGSPWLSLSAQDLPNGNLKISTNGAWWVLIDASNVPSLGLGMLLRRLQDEVKKTSEETFDVVAKRVVVRAEPSLEAELLGALEECDQIKGWVETVDGRTWLRLASFRQHSNKKLKMKAYVLIDGESLGLPLFLEKATGPPKEKAKPKTKPKAKPKAEPVDFGDLSKWTHNLDGLAGLSFRVKLSTVNVRSLPHVKSKLVAILRADDVVEGERRGDWLLLTPDLEPAKLAAGLGKWVLIDGASIGRGLMMERYLPNPELKRVYGEAMEVKLPEKEKEKCILEVGTSSSSDTRCMRCGRGKIMVVHGLVSNTEVKLRFIQKEEDKVVAASSWSTATTPDVPEWEEGDEPVMDMMGVLRGSCAQCDCKGYVMDDNVTLNMDVSDARCTRCGCNVAAHEVHERSDDEDEEGKKKKKKKKDKKPKGPLLVDKAIALPLETMIGKWSQFDLSPDATTWPTLEGDFKEVVAWSDLHSDMGTNMTHLKSLPVCKETVLLLAGDVATKIDTIESSLRLLQEKYGAVFYVPGNHELWVNKEDGITSIHKFMMILELCEKLGVHTRPAFVSKTCAVCPLFTWYKDNLLGNQFNREMANIAFDIQTMWPWDLTGRGDTHDAQQHEIADFFHKLNERRLKIAPREAIDAHQAVGGGELTKDNPDSLRVIGMSHFLPRHEVYPGPRRLIGVMGCAEIEQQIREIGTSIHIFGHSHVAVDRTFDKIRYVQHPLGYPSDFHRKVRPMRVWGPGGSSVPNVVDELPAGTIGRELHESLQEGIKNCTIKAMERPPGRWNDPDGGWDDRDPFHREAEAELRKALGFDFEAFKLDWFMHSSEGKKEEKKKLNFTIRSLENEDDTLSMEVDPDTAIAKIKDLVVKETGRGPATKIILIHGGATGGENALRNEVVLSDLDEQSLIDDGLILSGISLAPPQTLDVTIKHAAKPRQTLKLQVLDTSSILDVRKAIQKELQEEDLQNIKLVEKAGASLKELRNAEPLGDRTELLFTGRELQKDKKKPPAVKTSAKKVEEKDAEPSSPTSPKSGEEPQATMSTSYDFDFNNGELKISLPVRTDGKSVTVLDLKRAICAKVMRGPEKAVQLTSRGVLLEDKADLSTIKPAHRDKVKLTGIELGPPKLVKVLIVHGAAEERQELPITIKDTCRIADVRLKICKRLGETKMSQVKIVETRGGGGFISIPDQEFLNKRFQLIMMGRDLPAPGQAPPEEEEEEHVSGVDKAVDKVRQLLQEIQKDLKTPGSQKAINVQLTKLKSGKLDIQRYRSVIGTIYASVCRDTLVKFGFTDPKKMYQEAFGFIWDKREVPDIQKSAWETEELLGFSKAFRGSWFGIEDPNNTVSNGGGTADGSEGAITGNGTGTVTGTTKEKPSAGTKDDKRKPSKKSSPPAPPPVQKDIKLLDLMCTVASEDGETIIDVLLPNNGGNPRTVLDLRKQIAKHLGRSSVDGFGLGLADLPEPFPDEMQLDDESLQWSLKKTAKVDVEQIQEVFVVFGIDLVEPETPAPAAPAPAPAAEESVSQEQELGEEVDLLIWIDREFELSQMTRARLGVSVAELKEKIAREDPSGMINADEIGLKVDGRMLGDSERISSAFKELDLCGKDE